MAAAMIVGAVYNLINAGFIGSLHDTALLAAVTLGSPLLGLVMAVGGVFGVGGGALVSRLLGASEHEPGEGRRDQARLVVRRVGRGDRRGRARRPRAALPATRWCRCSARTPPPRPRRRAFVGVMLAFVPVLAAAFCLEQLVRAEGAARQVMVGLIASTVANLVLDVLFILVLHWGVAGAALAMGLPTSASSPTSPSGWRGTAST